MTDDDILLSHARDRKAQCADRGMITHTAFLDLHQRSLLARLERENSADVQASHYQWMIENLEQQRAIQRTRLASLLDSIRNLMGELKFSAEKAMTVLKIPPLEQEKYLKRL